MKAPILSKKTLLEFREHFVGWAVRTISDEFDAAEIACDMEHTPSTSGARRSLVEQYYQTLDFTKLSDVRKLLRVFENVLAKLEDDKAHPTWGGGKEYAERELRKLIHLLRRDGFEYKDGRLVAVGDIPATEEIEAAAITLDAPYIRTQIERMQNHINDDPRLVIGTAKELVETVCKTILRERGNVEDPTWETMELVKVVREELQLVPDAIPDAAKAAKTMKVMLANLATIAQGLAELRNLYGSGHGPDGKPKGLQPRHARLAAGAATTLATFLIETHHEREK